MKRYAVRLTGQALLDLDDIAAYIGQHDSPERAEHVARNIERVFSTLRHLPKRGAHPRELLALGNRHFREVRYKPYRMVYRVYDRDVVIFLITDGRRDMQMLLTRRLLSD